MAARARLLPLAVLLLALPRAPGAQGPSLAEIRALAEAGQVAESESLLHHRLLEEPAAPERGEALLLAARLAAARGEGPLAFALLGQLLAGGAEGELAGRALFERAALRAAADPLAAREDLERLQRQAPGHPLAGFAGLRLAEQALAAGEQARALAELDALLARFDEAPLAGAALAQRAALHEAAGRPGAAAADLASLRGRFPERAAAAERELGLLLDAGEESAARALWSELAARDSTLAASPALRAVAAELLLREGDAAARDRRLPEALAAWERAVAAAAGAEPAAAALHRLARAAERGGDGPRALALHARLLAEHPQSPWASEAAERQERLVRYYPVDREAALARLLEALRAQETASGEIARERELAVGRLLLEDFKDFSAASEHFLRLAPREPAGEARARALLAAGRAALREAERLALAGAAGTEAAVAWRERARRDLEAGIAEGAAAPAAEARGELAALPLAALPPEADRLPALSARLAAGPEGPALAPYYYERAELLRARGAQGAALAQARADAERAQALAPAGPWAGRAALVAGQLALAAGDSAQAKRRLAALAAGAGREAAEAHFELGRLEAAARHPRRASAHFERFLAGAPGSPRRALGQLWLGDCQLRAGDAAAAEASYAALLAAPGAASLEDDARYRLGLCAERRGDSAAARARFTAVLGGDDARLRREAAWRLATAAAAAGRPAEALAALAGLTGPGLPAREAARLRGELQLALGQGEAALALLDSLLAPGADAPPGAAEREELAAQRIRALLLTGRRQSALEAWQELRAGAALAPEAAAALELAFGQERLLAGDRTAAARHFVACRDEYPAAPAAGEARGELLLLALPGDELAGAPAELDSLRACCGGSASVRRAAEAVALALAGAGDWTGASELFAWCLARDNEPGPELLQDAATALARAGRRAEAVHQLARFLDRYPEDPRAGTARLERARLLQELGDCEGALLAYREAELYLLEDAESRARLRFWIGDCLESLGEREAAAGAFLGLAERFPAQGLWGVTALLRAAALCEVGGELARAEQLYARALAAQGPGTEIGASAAAGLARLAAQGERP
ncbi:tetratricopeptide repeat protein [bacterium]|nr:tetratricopeptide repeat protein [bacterium]